MIKASVAIGFPLLCVKALKVSRDYKIELFHSIFYSMLIVKFCFSNLRLEMEMLDILASMKHEFFKQTLVHEIFKQIIKNLFF